MPHKLGSPQRLITARLQNHYTDKRGAGKTDLVAFESLEL